MDEGLDLGGEMEEQEDLSQGGELGNTEFWKDLPDEILEDLYYQLDQPGATMGLEDDDINNSTPMVDADLISGMALRHRSGVKEEDGEEEGEGAVDPRHVMHGEDEEGDEEVETGERQLQPKMVIPPPQPVISQDQAKARLVIDQVHALYQSQEQQLDQMRQIQQQLILQPQKEGIRQLQEQQWKLNQQIELELKEVQALHRSVILDPPALHQLRMLLQRLKIQQQKIELFRQELQLVLNPRSPPPCIAALVLTDQPTPQVLFKGKTLEDSYVLILLTGSNVNVQTISKVRAILVADEKSWKTKKPIENETQNMDPMKRISIFHNIKLNVSTRMSMVYLKFGVQVQLAGDGGTHAIESAGSSPIIVITNESQWCDAAGKLLLFEAFGGQAEIPWQHLANVTHTHFLKATRQEPGRPSRRLNHGEYQYLHYKFFSGQLSVTQQQASKFWVWFGQVVQALRFKRHIANLWFTGLIYGFITKAVCNGLLSNEEVGTFIIRFSEGYPGLFAIAYVDDDPYDRVKHYLVKPEDISSNKSLPDFLREKPQFTLLNQLDPQTGELRKFAKDAVLKGYYAKRKGHKPTNGYVLL
eukprot:TRINITY_DN1578_c0_g1_i1.p1 TRINITY_DN1578_c0_g1~~TRINITY_DN1578_c0_g1_i1.p1  ORF type:complete len:586 (+),score=130.15 TRINITY_DN1578_c0_g1_i1:247-2004(+)